MIRVGDKVVPYFDMSSTGTVISIETLNKGRGKVLTSVGPTSLVQYATVRLDKDASKVMRFKLEDLLKAGV